MATEAPPQAAISADSFLEFAFLRWVLAPATTAAIIPHVHPQRVVEVEDRAYRLDYEIAGATNRIAVELDGFEFHSSRSAFTYDRLRQNDLVAGGRLVVRFSYDAIRSDTERCVRQLQEVLALDPELAVCLVAHPAIETPVMEPDPLAALGPPLPTPEGGNYFDQARSRLDRRPLRDCQAEAFAALTNYYLSGGKRAACVMAVGAGKTALGVAAALAFSHKRALVITPGSVIRGTFDRAFDAQAVGNSLYGLPGGPLIPGLEPPRTLTLDREEGAIGRVPREDLLRAQVIITNFHSLGTGESESDLLAKLGPDDIDLVIVDEAHIAAADSYRRAFEHFDQARTLLMSACFQRMDGRPIEADVVYRYRLIDSIADGNAKNLRLHRFAPDPALSRYEVKWPDGETEIVQGRDQALAILDDERRLAHVTASSEEPIRQVMRAVRSCLDRQATVLAPVKPRVLFSAFGKPHAEQLARLATEKGIPTGYLHYSMGESEIRDMRRSFESDAGGLQGLVHLRMLGEGYDFPSVCVIVPMRPYGSFNECYQFIGRGIRIINDPRIQGRVLPEQQWLDFVYHAELGLDRHIEQICEENDMDPAIVEEQVTDWMPDEPPIDGPVPAEEARPEAVVLIEKGGIQERVLHDEERIEAARAEREREAYAQRYAAYVQSAENPVSFEQFISVMGRFAR